MLLKSQKQLEAAGYITRRRQRNPILGDDPNVLEAKVFLAFPGYGNIPYTLPVGENMSLGHQIRWLEITPKGIEHIETDEEYRTVKAESEEE